MPALQYNGSISQEIYNSSSLSGSQWTQLDYLNTPITWSTVNPNLMGLNLSNLLNNSLFNNISYSVNLTMTGSQHYDDSSYPTTDIALVVNGGVKYSKSYTASSPGSAGTGNYNVNDSFPISTYPANITLNVYNRCYPTLPGCISYSVTNLTLTLVLNIQLTVDCTGSNLTSQFCTDYCLTNATDCINDYIGYCLPNSLDMPITTSQPCQSFITNYIQNQGPLAQIDNPLEVYCKSKYKGFGDLFNSTDIIDQSICACHMPSQQYTAFEQQLYTSYPNFQHLGLVDQCLLPQCASSQYKSVTTTGKCNLPQCLNIASFNNNGTFNNSNVTVNQTSQCSNITGSSSGPSPSPSSGPSPNPSPSPGPSNNASFFSKYKYYIIGVSVFLLVLIIIIVIVIIANGKKQN